MPKKPGRGPKKHRRSPGGPPGGGGAGGGGIREGGGRSRPGRGKRGGPGGPRHGRPAAGQKTDYFMQPGRSGIFVVLRRPIGNRADPKICGTMPSRAHAKMLIQQLERAESVVKDLFMEATDDGIEALEAVLAACRDEVMKSGLPLRSDSGSDGVDSAAALNSDNAVAESPGDGTEDET